MLEIVNAANLEVEDVDELTSELWSDVAMAAASVAAVRQAAARQYGGGQDILQGLERESAAIVAESADAVVSIEGCLDPLSSEAQKLAPILLVLREQLGSSLALRLALNPARDVGALPIKSYYRYAAPAVPPAAPPAAFFDGLPSTKTLTLGARAPSFPPIHPQRPPQSVLNPLSSALCTFHGQFLWPASCVNPSTLSLTLLNSRSLACFSLPPPPVQAWTSPRCGSSPPPSPPTTSTISALRISAPPADSQRSSNSRISSLPVRKISGRFARRTDRK